MKILAFILTIFLFTINSYSQTPNWLWAKQAIGTNENEGMDIATDVDNNSYTCGLLHDSASFDSFSLYSSNLACYVAKYDSNGVVQWANIIHSANGCRAFYIEVDNQNNCIVSGNFTGVITVGSYTLTPAAYDNLFLIKYNSSGTVLWAVQANTTDWQPRAMTIDNSGNIYLCTAIFSPIIIGGFNANKTGGAILKFDNNGNLINLINDYSCTPSSIRASGDNKIYYSAIVGDTTIIGNDTLYPSGYYEYIFNGAGYDTIYTLSSDQVFICYDTTGQVIWVKQAKSKTNEEYNFSAIDNNSNFYISGYVYDTTNYWGTLLYPTGTYTPFLLKIDSLGNIKWIDTGQPITSGAWVVIHSIECKNDFIYLNGHCWGTSSFASLNFKNKSNANAIIAKIDASGVGILQVCDSTNLPYNYLKAISIDEDENIIATGYFRDSILFGNHYLNSFPNPWYNMFIAKLKAPVLLGVSNYNSNMNTMGIQIFPNPFNSQTTIWFNEEQKKTTIRITDILGKEIKTIYATGKQISLAKGELKSGIYLLRISDEKNRIINNQIIIQ